MVYDLWENWGRWFSRQRRHKKMTQVQVAEIVGIERTHLSDIENGKTGSKRETVQKLIEAIDGNVDEGLRLAGFASVEIHETDPDVLEAMSYYEGIASFLRPGAKDLLRSLREQSMEINLRISSNVGSRTDLSGAKTGINSTPTGEKSERNRDIEFVALNLQNGMLFTGTSSPVLWEEAVISDELLQMIISSLIMLRSKKNLTVSDIAEVMRSLTNAPTKAKGAGAECPSFP